MKDYLIDLYELRQELKWLLRKDFLEELIALAELIDRSYVDAYQRISDNGEKGTNCGYAVKAKELFMKLSEHNISTKITDIYKNYIEEK